MDESWFSLDRADFSVYGVVLASGLWMELRHGQVYVDKHRCLLLMHRNSLTRS